MLGILVLATVNAYIVQIFFKTVFLVIMFSMLHGLVLLPIFLTVILPTPMKPDSTCQNEEQKRKFDVFVVKSGSIEDNCIGKKTAIITGKISEN